MSILVLYLTYFSMAVFWGEGKNEMVNTLTNLLMVVIPFYFGASAAVQWGQKKRVEANAEPSSPK
jgi:hypothetical protein